MSVYVLIYGVMQLMKHLDAEALIKEQVSRHTPGTGLPGLPDHTVKARYVQAAAM